MINDFGHEWGYHAGIYLFDAMKERQTPLIFKECYKV